MQLSHVESIRNWFNTTKNYQVGLALCNTYCHDPALLKVLAQGESVYRKGLMEQALREVLSQLKKSTHASPAPPPTKKNLPAPAVPPQPSIPAKKEDDPYYEKWQPIYVEMNALRHDLKHMTNDVERGATAFKILELEEQLYYYWELRDYYRRTGSKSPDTKEPVSMRVTDINAAESRLRTVRTYVTRYRNKLQEDPQNVDHQMRLDKYQKEKDELEELLNKKNKQ